MLLYTIDEAIMSQLSDSHFGIEEEEDSLKSSEKYEDSDSLMSGLSDSDSDDQFIEVQKLIQNKKTKYNKEIESNEPLATQNKSDEEKIENVCAGLTRPMKPLNLSGKSITDIADIKSPPLLILKNLQMHS